MFAYISHVTGPVQFDFGGYPQVRGGFDYKPQMKIWPQHCYKITLK
jgi:hypothetical protein